MALLLRPPAQRFLYVNEAIAASVARQVLLGAELYHDVADWKAPVGYLLYAAVLKVTNFSLVAVHLMGWLFVVLLLLCAGGLAHRVSGRRAALAAGAFTLVFLVHTLGPAVEVDLFMALFSAGDFSYSPGFYMAKHRSPLWP